MRAATPAVLAASRGQTARITTLVEVDHPVKQARLWKGIGDLKWGDKVFKGTGALGAISAVGKSQEISIFDINLTFSMALMGDLDTFYSGEIKGKEARVWRAFLDERWNIIPEPTLELRINLDTRSHTLNEDGSVSLTLMGQAGVYQLQKPLGQALTDEEQRSKYPDDTGFSKIKTMISKKTIWSLK